MSSAGGRLRCRPARRASAVDAINKWFVQVVGSEETKKFLNNNGGDKLILTPDAAQQMMLKEIENWREYVKIAKITPQG